jgi:phospholipase/carboxylesterase
MTQKIDGPHYGPQGGGKPGHLVVLLHGYGADGNDLIGLAPVLAPLMPDVVFHAPHAPYPCEGNPMGFQWFGISRLDPAVTLAGVRSAAPFVETFLDETMVKYGLDESKTALIGFSQGTMMALHVGLRRAKPLAGIIGFSGLLAGKELLGSEIRSRPPVLLVHGDSDSMLPHQLTLDAAAALKANGVPVEFHIAKGLGHGIDQTGLSLAARFLVQAFNLQVPQ